MNATTAVNLLKALTQDDLIFAYSGLLSNSITHKVIELTHFNIDTKGSLIKLRNKISFLMAECYQNVIRHGKHSVEIEDMSDYSGSLFFRSQPDYFYIASGNAVHNEYIASIMGKLEKVNSLNSDELRLLQKQILAEGKFSERGGAGLGIIEMARRTGRKISYDFDPIDEKTSVFFIQLTIPNPDIAEEDLGEEESINYIKELYAQMRDDNVVILHKGDFSENSTVPLIQMIENNIMRHEHLKAGKQKLYNISVELLQNISMHSRKSNYSNKGLFILEQSENSTGIATCNFVSEQDEEFLVNHLNHLSSLSKDELNNLYRKKLISLVDEGVNNVGIGLIYVYRKTQRVDYLFSDHNGGRLFSLFVEL